MNTAGSMALKKLIPYARQTVDEQDIEAVIKVLRSDWLTTGPTVDVFEEAVATFVEARYAVAVSSGTAALHAAMYAIEISQGDEVIVPPMTFAATANAVVFQGGVPVFADVTSDTLLIDPEKVREKISPRTKAIVAVDYAGQPCDYAVLRKIADENGIVLVADACHALGAKYKDCRAGSLADLSVFSFHPVKHITTGEGGMVTTDNNRYAKRMRRFRNHCIDTDHRQRAEKGGWFYQMVDLGYNYRISDIQCALGISQLKKLPEWIKRRRKIAEHYTDAFSSCRAVEPLAVLPDRFHAYHLYVIRVKSEKEQITRDELFTALRSGGVGANVHYIPVHLHPFYRETFKTAEGLCPVSEAAYRQIISLPIYSGLNDADVDIVIHELLCATDKA